VAEPAAAQLEPVQEEIPEFLSSIVVRTKAFHYRILFWLALVG
jgi:hypothetical protein